MKKSILLLVVLISCGPSESEIQAQIDQAVQDALEVVEESTTTSTSSSTSTTSTSSTSTTTSSTTTTTQILTPLITIDKCPSEVTAPNGFTVEYTLIARSSDIESLSTKTYWDGELEYENYYTTQELDLPKKSLSNSWITTFAETVEFSRAYKVRTVYTATNSAGLTFTESCTVNVISNTTTQSTQGNSSSTKPYPPDPASSTWIRFEGTYKTTSELIDLSEMSPGLKIAHVEYNGGGYFSIKSYDSNNDYITLDVSHIGSYVADIPINFGNENYYSLQVEGDGRHEIVIKPVSASINFDVPSITNRGSVVIEAYDLEYESKKISFEHVGNDYVSVKEYECDGSYNGLPVSEIGDYTGTYLSQKGTCFIVINTDSGSWTISK